MPQRLSDACSAARAGLGRRWRRRRWCRTGRQRAPRGSSKLGLPCATREPAIAPVSENSRGPGSGVIAVAACLAAAAGGIRGAHDHGAGRRARAHGLGDDRGAGAGRLVSLKRPQRSQARKPRRSARAAPDEGRDSRHWSLRRKGEEERVRVGGGASRFAAVRRAPLHVLAAPW